MMELFVAMICGIIFCLIMFGIPWLRRWLLPREKDPVVVGLTSNQKDDICDWAKDHLEDSPGDKIDICDIWNEMKKYPFQIPDHGGYFYARSMSLNEFLSWVKTSRSVAKMGDKWYVINRKPKIRRGRLYCDLQGNMQVYEEFVQTEENE